MQLYSSEPLIPLYRFFRALEIRYLLTYYGLLHSKASELTDQLMMFSLRTLQCQVKRVLLCINLELNIHNMHSYTCT